MSTATGTVERLYAHFASGDLDAVLELLDPQVEWVTPPTLPWSRGSYHGRDQVLAYFHSFGAALEAPAVVPERLLDCDETIVALGHESGRARATGRDFRAAFAHVITVRDGRVTGLRGHVDTAAIRTAFDNLERVTAHA